MRTLAAPNCLRERFRFGNIPTDVLLAKTQISKKSETMKLSSPMSIAFAIVMASLLSVSGATFAQESGAPNQSGGQEPEVPGTSSSTPQNSVKPEGEKPPTEQRDRRQEADKRAEKQRKCAPGKDAKACREHGRNTR